MTIDHDVLMMIYGALIGVVSSIATSLFQSWLNRREHERQRKEEEKRAQHKIQTATFQDILAVRKGMIELRPNGEFPKSSPFVTREHTEATEVRGKIEKRAPFSISTVAFPIMLLVLLCIGAYLLINWMGSYPEWRLGVSAFLTVWIIYIIIYFVRALQEETTRPTSHDQ